MEKKKWLLVVCNKTKLVEQFPKSPGTPPKFNSSPLKMDGWKTILSFWEGNFSGVKLRHIGCIFGCCFMFFPCPTMQSRLTKMNIRERKKTKSRTLEFLKCEMSFRKKKTLHVSNTKNYPKPFIGRISYPRTYTSEKKTHLASAQSPYIAHLLVTKHQPCYNEMSP